MSAVLNIGIDLGGRTISASTLPSSTIFTDDKIVLRTHNGNYIREYPYSSNISHLDVFYNGESYLSLFSHNNAISTGVFQDVTLPDDFGVVTEVTEDSVSYPYIHRTDHEKVYAFTEDLNKVELNGTALYPDVLFDGETQGNVILSKSAAGYSHMRIYFHTDDDYYSSVDLYEPNGKAVYLMCGVSYSSGSNTFAFIKAKTVRVSETAINEIASSIVNLGLYPNIEYNKTDVIYITRVEAWN